MLRKAAAVAMLFILGAVGASPARAGIADFGQWTLVQDPPHANLSASATSTQATLLALNGPIPGATDIGYQSVNGSTPATSTAGYAFDPSADFSIAVDYALSFGGSPAGMLGIGFGVGEDGGGRNVAGATLLTSDGAFGLLGAAARVNDVNQPAKIISLTGSLSGTLFATYTASTGSIALGVSSTPGASSPSASATYAGIQDQWSGGPLLASFFLRSEGSLGEPWQSGSAEAIFSNFRVLNGAPTAVPEPASLTLIAAAGVGLMRRRRRSV